MKSISFHWKWLLCLKKRKNSNWSKRKITALISRGLKKIDNNWRKGTIIIKKNGKANENSDDLTAQSTTNAPTCTIVYTCIFHANTRRTYGSGGWYLTGIKNSPSLMGKQSDKNWISKSGTYQINQIHQIKKYNISKMSDKLIKSNGYVYAFTIKCWIKSNQITVQRIEHRSSTQHPYRKRPQTKQPLESIEVAELL